VFEPCVAVPIGQVKEQPFDSNRGAGFQERLNHLGAQASKALEDQVGVFVGGRIERAMLEEFENGALHRRDRYAQLSIAVFAESNLRGQKVGPDVAYSAEPWKTSKPAREPVVGSAEKIDRIIRTQRDEVCATEDFQRGASAGMDGSGLLLKAINGSHPSRNPWLRGKGAVPDAVQPTGTRIVVGESAGYASAFEP